MCTPIIGFGTICCALLPINQHRGQHCRCLILVQLLVGDRLVEGHRVLVVQDEIFLKLEVDLAAADGFFAAGLLFTVSASSDPISASSAALFADGFFATLWSSGPSPSSAEYLPLV